MTSLSRPAIADIIFQFAFYGEVTWG